MQAQIKVTTVKKLINKAIKQLEAFRELNPGGRAAQYVKVKGMQEFIKVVDRDGEISITQDDYLALTQLP
jgi:hypothetical protein